MVTNPAILEVHKSDEQIEMEVLLTRTTHPPTDEECDLGFEVSTVVEGEAHNVWVEMAKCKKLQQLYEKAHEPSTCVSQ